MNTISRSSLDSYESFDSIQLQKELPATPYHVFSESRIRVYSYLAGATALFSGLSSNIYFPALDAIAQNLHVSIEQVNLSITIYMIFQAISPSFWSPLADVYGRRPILLACFLLYVVANVGLGLSHSFGALMAFRGLQSAAAASTVSISVAIIVDISNSSSRARHLAVGQTIRYIGISFAPVLGGILAQFLGFRSIFWFLTIAATLSLLTIYVILAETHRPIAGDGTIPLQGIHKPLLYTLFGQPDTIPTRTPQKPAKFIWSDILRPLSLFTHPDILAVLILGAIPYTLWSMVTSTTTNLFKTTYHFKDLQIGLAFLPNGVGGVMGSLLVGPILDKRLRLAEEAYKAAHNIPQQPRWGKVTPSDFAIFPCRLNHLWIVLVVLTTAITAYGPSFHFHFAIPLAIQFVISLCHNIIFSVVQVLVVDLYAKKSASATAVNNLARCTLGAVGVGVAQPIIDGVGLDVAFLVLAALMAGSAVALVFLRLRGQKWRMKRELTMQQQS